MGSFNNKLTVIGGGLAGCEAAWQAAERAGDVTLYEMRPYKNTPAHKTPLLGELVCSNSFKSNSLETAAGLLKEELRSLNSLLIAIADKISIPAGSALVVERTNFSSLVTSVITNHKNIKIIQREVSSIPEEDTYTIIATGPLTSDQLITAIIKLTGEENLYFYDAIAPIIDADSLDYNRTFRGNRYEKGDGYYLNCPLTEEEYTVFYNALIKGEVVNVHEFEKEYKILPCLSEAKDIFFEACLPIEEMAYRGFNTLLFGPMRPVGLVEPHTNKRPFAVLQLRQEDIAGKAYNMVGFQTRLKYPEQKRIFSLIPALTNAEYVQHGSFHRNTFINSPKILTKTLQCKKKSNILFAGQITGAEGYIESIATGLIAGIMSASLIRGEKLPSFSEYSPICSLLRYLTASDPERFHPMHINFSLFPQNETSLQKQSKREKRLMMIQKILISTKGAAVAGIRDI